MPAFVPERKEVWYSEAYTGFYAVKITNGAWPDAKAAPAPLVPPVDPPAAAPAPTTGGNLPATGSTPWLPMVALGSLVLLVVVRRRRTA
jgi:LPXTG-motif cell wall-anchored protein